MKTLSASRGQIAGITESFYAVNLGVSWEIDLWGRIRRLNEGVRAQVLATEDKALEDQLRPPEARRANLSNITDILRKSGMTCNRCPAAAAIALAFLALAATPAQGQAELMGPLRIRDMAPFSLLRLDMLPAHAATGGPGSWAIETEITHTNTFVMSSNVRIYLEGQGERRTLMQADVDRIQSLGEDAYYVDGEFGLLDLTFHYAATHGSSIYLTLPVYDYMGGFLDGTVESFHDTFGLSSSGRAYVDRNRFQAVASFGGQRVAVLGSPVEGGLGDPVLGVRQHWPLGASPWRLVLDGAAKVALGGERPFLSTGSNDYGLQASLQGKLNRQGLYFSASAVRTDGQVLGVPLGSRVIPTLTAAWEVGLTRSSNIIFQLYASESAVRDTSIEEIRANKYQASLGLRSRRGHLVYGFAVTENLVNFENTPDVGVSLTLAWISPRP